MGITSKTRQDLGYWPHLWLDFLSMTKTLYWSLYQQSVFTGSVADKKDMSEVIA